MNIRRFITKLIPCTLSTIMLFSASPFTGTADNSEQIVRKGDINNDGDVNTVDLSILSLYLSGKASISRQGFINADMDEDGSVDSLDLILFRKAIINPKQQYSSPPPDVTSSAYYATTTQTTTSYFNEADTVTVDLSLFKQKRLATASAVPYRSSSQTALPPAQPDNKFIKAPLSDMDGSLPSQDNGRICIFYVDFPDCPYQWSPLTEKINDIAFGEENLSDTNYPHESLNAFYQRASKHTLTLSGQTYRYTTKYNKDYYENDTHKLIFVNEVLDAFDDVIDYNNFDGNKDGTIDTVIISVPAAAGEEVWWPCVSSYTLDQDHLFDGLWLSHIIIGNAEIKNNRDYENFTTSYIHELGHCFGLPDYYLYNNRDSEGLHGSAGFDTMDELFADFSCASKLMLGWYRGEQIQVYDGSDEQTFTLTNAQSDAGNCVIIPCGELDENYRSEFLILEYTTLEDNNSEIPNHFWWRTYGEGVRIFHVEATGQDTRTGINFLYRSGNNPATNFDLGKRFIRVVNDSNYDNLFRTGNIINHDSYGFGFYDEFGLENTDPGVEITIGDLVDDTYTITIRKKGLSNGTNYIQYN